MNFTEMVDQVADRLNLTSADAKLRIGDLINVRYKRVTTAVNVITSRRHTSTVDLDGSTSTDLPIVYLDEWEKVVEIWLTDANGNTTRVLDELLYEELIDKATLSQSPSAYAIKRVGAGYVTIQLDAFPATTFTLNVDGYDIAETLSDLNEPYFPTDYHYILVEGAMADEYRRMQMKSDAADCEQVYKEGLSDLKFFLMKNVHLDIQQGKNSPSSRNPRRYRRWDL